MKKLYLFPLVFLLALTAGAQSVFTLDGPSGTRVYTTLDTAMIYSQDGDYLYLPATSISIPAGLMIKKRLNIIGAGHYPDSTQATGPTVITANIHLWTTASGSMLQGVYVQGNIYFGVDPATGGANNISISRCSFNNIFLSIDGSTFYGAENVNIKDNVIRENIFFAGVKNVVVENNIINGSLQFGNGMITIRNNIMLRNTANLMYYLGASRWENNIILGSASWSYGSGSNLFYNNIFKEGDPLGAEFSIGNQFNVSDLFINQSGTTFSYMQNYHLTATSPAKLAGLAGTDCGIFGGGNPYKEGAVPVNPHIQSKLLPAQTDAQGKLNVQVKVAAQNQ
jgi:hypothetical protein